MTYRQDNHIDYHILSLADVIMVDEFSMLTCINFEFMLLQLKHARGATTLSDVFRDVGIILIGDPKQLLPICSHTVVHPAPLLSSN